MACNHGHPFVPTASGECLTCLETDYCGCEACKRYYQRHLDQDPTLAYLMEPAWYRAHVSATFGQVTQDNYKHVARHVRLYCECKNAEDAAHDEQECRDDECRACGIVKCPRNDDLHFHRDGCPSCRQH
jgi:hypothetical protein